MIESYLVISELTMVVNGWPIRIYRTLEIRADQLYAMRPSAKLELPTPDLTNLNFGLGALEGQ